MGNIVIAVTLTLLSGVCDALGFVHASRVWKSGDVAAREVVTSLAFFFAGAVAYLVVIRYLDRLGVTSPEVQTLGWFVTTVVGMGVIERSILGWAPIDKAMLLVAALSVGWLVVRQG